MKRTGFFVMTFLGALTCSAIAMAQPMGPGRPGGPFPPNGEFRNGFRQELDGQRGSGMQGEGRQRGPRAEAGRPGPGGPEARPQEDAPLFGERFVSGQCGFGMQGGGPRVEKIIIIERIIERVVPADSPEIDGPRRVERMTAERRGPAIESDAPQRGTRAFEGNLPGAPAGIMGMQRRMRAIEGPPEGGPGAPGEMGMQRGQGMGMGFGGRQFGENERDAGPQRGPRFEGNGPREFDE